MKIEKERKEEPVKNYPGIYKRMVRDPNVGTWKLKGYRATRWTKVDGVLKREQCICTQLEEAKAFRSMVKPQVVEDVDSSSATAFPGKALSSKRERFTFGALIEDWKAFHYLSLERSTKQTYDKLLPSLDFLKPRDVAGIDVAVIDELVKYWVTEFPKSSRRQTFEAELDLLKTILNFYRRRKNRAYLIPIFEEHYKAADVAKKAKKAVKALSQEDLGRFLEALRTGRTSQYYAVALAQFCLGLRIGEALGMTWDVLDLNDRVVRIERTIDWDQRSWEAFVKERPKNGNERVLVIPKVLAEELIKMKARRDPNVAFVFHKSGKPLNRKTIATAYNRTLKSLGITHVSGTHMMRKTSATQANRVTGDFYAVSKLLDHSSPSITLKYVEEVSDQKRKVADALNGVVEGLWNGSLNPPDGGSSVAVIPHYPPKQKKPILRLVKSAS